MAPRVQSHEMFLISPIFSISSPNHTTTGDGSGVVGTDGACRGPSHCSESDDSDSSSILDTPGVAGVPCPGTMTGAQGTQVSDSKCAATDWFVRSTEIVSTIPGSSLSTRMLLYDHTYHDTRRGTGPVNLFERDLVASRQIITSRIEHERNEYQHSSTPGSTRAPGLDAWTAYRMRA